MFFRSQDGLLVPHNLPSRNHFVKALQEAFESTLKEVRANFILASLFATSLGAAADLAEHPPRGDLSRTAEPSHGVGGEEDNFVPTAKVPS